MKKFTAVLFLCIQALGQAVYSGHSLSSGFAVNGYATGTPGGAGAPLTYAARTDNCETGSESQCIVGALVGASGSALSFLGRAGDVPPKSGPGPAVNGQYLTGLNSIITDPDFGTQMVRATDYSLANGSAYPCGGANGLGLSFNLGSGGGLHLWSSDSSKLLISSTSGENSILSFNPATMQITPSALCGSSALGFDAFAFAQTDPHTIFGLNNDQESTVRGAVTSGTLLTPEQVKQASTNAQATLYAVNTSSLIQIGAVTGGTADALHTWVGQSSGAVFTPTATPTPLAYSNTLFKGTINDAGAPNTWTIAWSLLFNFNYVAGLGAPNFPTGPTTCLPAGYDASYNGLFIQSDDDTSFTMIFSDNGQVTKTGGSCTHSPGGVCTGPTNVANFTVGAGCRILNTMTDQIAGDYGPTGQALNGQANTIPGTISGTFAIGETLTQNSTNATTTLDCTQSSGVCSTSGLNGVLVGLIYGTADNHNAWTGATSHATLTPTALPTNPPFYYPDVIHDTSQSPNAAIANVGFVQPSNGKISQVQGNTGVNQTTITLQNSPTYNAGQQVLFYGMTGAHDGYLNCVNANQCPIWTVVTGTSGGTLVISDSTNPNGAYTDAETPSTAVMSPNGSGSNGGYGFYSNPNLWNVRTLVINPCLASSCQGHSAEGKINSYRAKYYTAHNLANPSLPCAVNGPATPCPGNSDYPLLVASVPVDQHGTYNQHGATDQTPVGMVTTNVCGMASGAGNGPCDASYTAAYYDELIAIENFIARPAGADCNYGAGATGCVYRLGHTFNSGDNWNFNLQNAIGNISPDGHWLAFPSTWANTLGCMDGSTNCWSSYNASGPANATITAVQVDVSGIVTMTAANQFCTPGGVSANGVPCGTLPEQVTLSGLSSSGSPNDSWLNNATLTITSATSSSFVGTTTATNPWGAYGPISDGGKAAPVVCTGGVSPCQRGDIWIANLMSAH